VKIIELKVSNFRSLKGEDIKISFEDTNIIFLLGQNNAGKSSFMEAYQYFVKSKQKASLKDFYNYDDNNSIVIEGKFLKEDSDTTKFQDQGLEKWVCSDNFVRIKKEWAHADKEAEKYTFNPANNEWIKNGFGGIDTIFSHHAPTPIKVPAMPSLDELKKWASETLNKVVYSQLMKDEVETVSVLTKHIHKLQQELQQHDYTQKAILKANENFAHVFPNLSLSIESNTEQIPDFSKLLEKKFDLCIEDTKLSGKTQPIESQGDGVIRFAMFTILGLLKDIVGKTSDKKFIVLFEEPEIYLHPKKLFMLRQCLYGLCEDSAFQIICASHSPALIDISKPHTSLIRMVKQVISNNVFVYQVGDSLFQSDEEDNKNKVQMINRFNPHICEAFFADEVILVEGDTEAIVFRELLDRMNCKKEIFVLNTGSKNNIPFFQTILSHFSIKQHIIHDLDDKFIRTKQGIEKKNSAWTLNEKIWELICKSNSLAKRYVFDKNFESAHDYEFDIEKGKPLSAWEWARDLDIKDTQMPCILFLNQILELSHIEQEFTMEELEAMSSNLLIPTSV
jgi:putative ATP-dependent endonuclease of OLD family